MHQTDCNGCGLSVYDLPDEAGDPETAGDRRECWPCWGKRRARGAA